jgi:hypothetical protein
MVQNMNIGGKWTWQGAMGPHGHINQCHMVSLGSLCGHATSLIRGRGSTRLHHRWFNVGLINGQNWAALVPWAHHHTLEELQPTSKPTYCPNNRLTYHEIAIRDPIHAVGSKGGGSKGWPTPLGVAWHPRVATDLPWLPTSTPTTSTHYKRAMVLGGEVPHTHSSIPSFSKFSCLE